MHVLVAFFIPKLLHGGKTRRSVGVMVLYFGCAWCTPRVNSCRGQFKNGLQYQSRTCFLQTGCRRCISKNDTTNSKECYLKAHRTGSHVLILRPSALCENHSLMHAARSSLCWNMLILCTLAVVYTKEACKIRKLAVCELGNITRFLGHIMLSNGLE